MNYIWYHGTGQASYPKVTVCPPRQTFTNLNYDLMTAEDVSLQEDERKELLTFAIDYIQDGEFERTFEEVKSYGQDGIFKDWYLGTTMLSLPYLNKLDKRETFVYNLNTSAASGCVSNSYFGRTFDKEKFKINENLAVDLLKPIEKRDSIIIIRADIDYKGSETNGHVKISDIFQE